jgi:hypothetical protein
VKTRGWRRGGPAWGSAAFKMGGSVSPNRASEGMDRERTAKGEQCDPWDPCVCPHSVVLSREPYIVISEVKRAESASSLGAWKRALVGAGALTGERPKGLSGC